MSDPVVPVTQESVVVALTAEQWETAKQEMRWSRRFAIVVLLAMVGLAAWNRWLLSDMGEVTKDVRENTRIIRNVTSPAAQQRDRERTQEIVVVIDCNNRAVVQQLVDGLVEQGLIQAFDVTQECHERGTP